MTEIEMKAAQFAADAKAAKDAAEAAAAEVKSLREEVASVKEENTNLDNSMNELKKENEAMKAKLDRAASNLSLKAQIAAALEARKGDIEKLLAQKDGRMTIEIKTDIGTSSVTPQSSSQVWGSNLEAGIAAAPKAPLTFLNAFGVKPFVGERIVWREASNTENVGYVAELAQNTQNTSIAFNEYFRKGAKIATYMTLSSEAELWLPELFDFCTNEGPAIVDKKINSELYNGNGDNSTYPNHVFGVLGQATTHVAQTTYSAATIADLIFDCAAQVKKAGFQATVAILPFAWEAKLRSVKDSTGNYIYDRVNHQLAGITIMPSDLLSAAGSGSGSGSGTTVDSLIVADASVVDVYVGTTYELELSRKPEYDAWRADFRKIAQCRVKGVNQTGVVKVANIATDIAAITPAS